MGHNSMGRRPVVPACLFTLLALSMGACSKHRPTLEERGLVGLWESIQVSPQGGGNSLVIRGDSTTTKFRVQMEEFAYRTEGDRVIVNRVRTASDPLPEDSVPVLTFEYAVSGDTLRKSVEGSAAWFARLGDAGDRTTLVGAWRAVRSTAPLTVHSFERYTADGRLQRRLPLAARDGRCDVFGDTLLALFPDEEPRRLLYRVAGDTLWLTAADGKPYAYLRTAPRGWYYMEQL